MKRTILATAVLMVWSTGALAWCANGYTEKACGTLHVCYQGTAPACPSDPTTSNTNNLSQGQGQSQGQSQGQGQSQSSNNSNRNSNKNVATGGTGIGIGVGGSASAGASASANGGAGGAGGSASTDSHAVMGQQQYAGGGSADIRGSGNGGVSNVEVNTETKEAAKSAFAATVTVLQSDSCATGAGFGAQALVGGLTASWTVKDEVCERIKLWRELRGAGFLDEAKELLRQDERVAKAFDSAHRDKRAVAVAPLPSNVYEGREIVSQQTLNHDR